jgi:hypothetical protein
MAPYPRPVGLNGTGEPSSSGYTPNGSGRADKSDRLPASKRLDEDDELADWLTSNRCPKEVLEGMV